ncbi:DUF1538 domain-containing protein [Balneolales bacterium ANBcel1]|nr:DUF1538 domain-containing protein [Balneolales bacterium ANBcel1]
MELKIFNGITGVIIEVVFALVPLIIFFLIAQVLFLRIPWKKVTDIIKGIVLAFFGLTLFLQGVHVGFEPAGKLMGEVLGSKDYRWVLVPIGFLLGFVATIAEPAIRILNHEVDKVSGGYIPKNVLLYTLCIGVGVSIALAMLRLLVGIPIVWLVLPGYIIALIMMHFTSPTFTSVAFDAGGVATGPMTVTFIMAIALGVGEALPDRNPMIDSFGMIALVALAPIISVLTLGLLYAWKERRND